MRSQSGPAPSPDPVGRRGEAYLERAGDLALVLDGDDAINPVDDGLWFRLRGVVDHIADDAPTPSVTVTLTWLSPSMSARSYAIRIRSSASAGISSPTAPARNAVQTDGTIAVGDETPADAELRMRIA